MPIQKKIVDDNYIIGIWKLIEGEDELKSLLSNFDVYSSQLDEIIALHRRLEWLCVRVLLNQLTNCEKIIEYRLNGAPFLVDHSYNISISHTRGYVTVILSKEYNVAIDIEYYSERVNRLSSRFIRDDEKVDVFNNVKTWSLLLHWSAKETAFKLIGLDNVDFLSHLKIMPFDISNRGSFVLQENRSDECRNLDIKYEIDNDFVLTYSKEKRDK